MSSMLHRDMEFGPGSTLSHPPAPAALLPWMSSEELVLAAFPAWLLEAAPSFKKKKKTGKKDKSSAQWTVYPAAFHQCSPGGEGRGFCEAVKMGRCSSFTVASAR